MAISLKTHQTLKWVHNEPLTAKERLSYHDDDEASIVPTVLSADPFFQESAETLASRPPDRRTAEAERIAKKYAAYKGPHQRLVVTCYSWPLRRRPAFEQRVSRTPYVEPSGPTPRRMRMMDDAYGNVGGLSRMVRNVSLGSAPGFVSTSNVAPRWHPISSAFEAVHGTVLSTSGS